MVCSIVARSAGVSTTQSDAGSRFGDAQTAQSSSSVKVLQRTQRRTLDNTRASAALRRCAPAGSYWRRWNAMRCADFGPTPGRQRSASINRRPR